MKKTTKQIIYFFPFLFILIGLTLEAQVTKAYTKIQNQASATYKFQDQEYTTETNLVVTQILPIYSVLVSPDGTVASPGQNIYGLKGSDVIIPYKIVNNGNDADSFLLSINIDNNSIFSPENIRILWDINGNGSKDENEPYITKFDNLPSEAFRNFLVILAIPLSANTGSYAYISPQAQSSQNNNIVDNNNIARIEVASGPVIDVKISHQPSTITPDGILQYTVKGSNVGKDIAKPILVNVDNVQTSGLLVSAKIPEAASQGTVFVVNSLTSSFGQVLYSIDNGTSWFSTPPAGIITNVAVLLPNGLIPDQSFAFDFKVHIDPNHAPGIIEDQASAFFQDASGKQFALQSNIVQAKVEVEITYDTLIGPIGNYADSVNGDNNADFQVINKVIAGNKFLYKFSVWNGSNASEVINFYTKSVPESWNVRFLYEDGMTSLIDTDNNNLVDVGLVDSKDVRNLALEIRIPADWKEETKAPINIEIFAILSSAPDKINRTNARINQVIPVSSLWNLRKINNADKNVEPNQLITYSLIFEQLESSTNLTNIVISDTISTHLTYIEFAPTVTIRDENGTNQTITATAIYDELSRVLSWTIDQLNGKFKGRVSFKARVKADVEDAAIISNQFTVSSSHNIEGLISNTIENVTAQMDLNVEKTVNKTQAKIGDILIYTLKVSGVASSTGSIENLKLYDQLPFGFSYEKGSTSINGKKIQDPEMSKDGHRLTFNIGTVKNQENIEIQFMTRIGPGVKIGENTNIAWATGSMPNGTKIGSLNAQVTTDVSEGVFAERAWVFGRVFIDLNNNESYECEQDIPVAGSRVYLENGQYAITDREGKYIVEDLLLGTHVIALDSITLPPNTKVKNTGRHSAMNGKTQFIDLKLPTSWRSDFMLELEKDKYIPCRATFQATMSQHNNSALLESSPLTSIFQRILLLPVDMDQVSKVDKIALQYMFDEITKQGKLGLNITIHIPNEKELSLTPEEIKIKLLPKVQSIIEILKQRFGMTEDTLNLKWDDDSTIPWPESSLSKVKNVEKTKGIISPKDGTVFMMENTVKVKISSLLQNRVYLQVNGQEVPANQIGSRSFNTTTGQTLFEYVAVPLQLGQNTITMISKDATGKEEKDSITVHRAKPPKKIIAKTSPHQIPADGITEPVVIIELHDEEGNLAATGIFLTVQIDNGNIITPDAQPDQLGHQIYVKEGKAECLLDASNEAKDCKFTAEIAEIKQEFKISYVPYLRDWIIVGLGEATAGLENWQERDGKDEGLYVNGRAAFFLKGRILGKFLLTANYDSDLPDDDKTTLMKQVDPDKYYSVYGDSSKQGYEVQSSGRLYVKLEQDRNYIMYGDYQTEMDGLLTAYNRTFRGLKGEIRTKYFEAKAFGSHAKQTMVQDEIRGQGISGYYFLSQQNIITNTTKVVIEIRDRFQVQQVIKTIDKTLYKDYDVNYERGWILFDTPILSADENGNPIYIVVNYETRNAISKEYIAGVQASVKFADEKIKLGGTYIYEGQDKGHTSIEGLHAEVTPIEKVVVRGEMARTRVYNTQTKETEHGKGYAVEAKADFDQLQGKIGYQKLTKDFRNPSVSGAIEGSEQYYAEANIKLSENIKAQVKAKRSETETTRVQGVGVRSSVKTGNFTNMLGYEFVEEKTKNSLTNQTTSKNAHIISAGTKWDVNEHWAIRAERHQVIPGERILNSQPTQNGTFTKASSNIKDDFISNNNGFNVESIGDRIVSRTLFGAEYTPIQWLRLWINQEFEDNFDLDLSRTLFGANLQLTKHVDLYTSYGLENGLSSDRSQGLIGLKTNIPFTQWLSGDVFVEQVKTFDGDNPQDFTSYGFGLRMNRIKEQGSLRIEFRHTDDGSIQFLGNPALTWKMNDSSTFFWRTRHFQNGHLNLFQHSTLLGFAYRPNCSDTMNIFNKVQFDWDRDYERTIAWEEMMLATSTDLNLRFGSSWDFMLRYAAKYNMVKSDKSKGTSFMDLIAIRALYEFHENFDAGVHAGILHDYESRDFQYAYGVEVGMKVVKNLWISLGYNIKGFQDRKMSGNDFLRDGIYITVRFKFDETTAEELLPAW